jgi:hypothetical protein
MWDRLGLPLLETEPGNPLDLPEMELPSDEKRLTLAEARPAKRDG